VSWTAFHLGHLLNRIGWGVEKAGARIMAWAAARLARKAGL
jgi:hypothetical protein